MLSISNLYPLTSEQSRAVADEVFKALSLLPNHRHNKESARELCETCQAKIHLIKAFRSFKRVGDK